jgi:hypothetical protein
LKNLRSVGVIFGAIFATIDSLSLEKVVNASIGRWMVSIDAAFKRFANSSMISSNFSLTKGYRTSGFSFLEYLIRALVATNLREISLELIKV